MSDLGVVPGGVSVAVLFVPFNGFEMPEATSPLKRKHDAVWDNTGRNELIATVAEKLARKPWKLIREYGINTAAVQLHDRVRQRVVVLVENVEHATRLLKLLPDWEVLHAIPTDDEPWDAEEAPNELPPRGVIATTMYVFRNGVACDILVRATAGTGRLSWDVIRGGYKKAGTTPALVVDIQDENGKREKTDTEIRRREYTEQSLKVLKATEKKGAT